MIVEILDIINIHVAHSWKKGELATKRKDRRNSSGTTGAWIQK